jgi:DNA-binding response OmpR family regulator
MTKNILILEDEPVLANIYKKNLESAGYKVKCAESVDEASKLLNEYKPDLALLDHGIKGEEEAGLDFVPKIKGVFPETRIVMLSNYSHFQIQEEAENLGVDDYLVKLNTPPGVLVDYVNKLFS